MNEPFIHLRMSGGVVRVDGVPSRVLGDRLSVPGEKEPQGIHAAWSWNGTRLEVENDRYGMYPLYYFSRGTEFALSPSILALLRRGVPRDIDEGALAVFLRLGFFLGSDTPFAGVRAVPACSGFSWENGRLTVVTASPRPRAAPPTRSDAVDGYISLFRQAMARRPPPGPGFAVPLSGGRDSRHILLEMNRVGLRPEYCLTARYYPSAGCSDVEAAGRLTAALGIRHLALDQPRSRLKAELRKNLLTDFCADEHTWYLAVADRLNGRSSAVYDGIGGDVLSAGLFLTPERLELFRAGRLEELAPRLWTDDREKALERMLPPGQYRRFGRAAAVERVAGELRRHAEEPNPVGAFYFANRTRREIVLPLCRLLRNAGTIFAPYLDHDLYDFLASLPAEMLVDHGFHTETIARAYPDCAGFPYAEKPPSDLPRRGYFRRFALELARYATGGPHPAYVRRGYLLPRLLRVLADGRYSQEIAWFGPPAAYLIQLQRLCEGGSFPASARRE